MTHAGFWRRLAAWLVDMLVLGLFMLGIGLIFGALGVADEWSEDEWNGLAFIATWLYFAGMESSMRQATFGKNALRLKVIDETGGQISFGRATGRYFGKILSSLTLGFGFLMIAFTDRKQGLHDKMAGCVVVVRPG